MLYLSSFNALSTDEQPNVLFFEGQEKLPELTDESRDDYLRMTRTVLGYDSRLNPVRGQSGDRYYFTYLKYSHQGNINISAVDNTVEQQAKQSDVVSPMCSRADVEDYVVFSPMKGSNQVHTTVINPGDGHSVLIWPEYAIKMQMNGASGGSGSVYCKQGVYGSAASEIVAQTVSIPNFDHSNHYYSMRVGISDDIPLHEGPTRSTIPDGYPIRFEFADNTGDGLFYSDEDIGFVDEVVSLDHAVICYEDKWLRLYSEVDFKADTGLIPGTRPYIQFIQSHTEL